MSSLNFKDKTYFITGVANKKSVATHTAKFLLAAGAKVIFSAQNEQNKSQIDKIFPESNSFILDVENADDLGKLKENILKHTESLDGFVHSIAFANFSEGPKPFHETNRSDFLQAAQISSFSLVEIANELKDIMNKNASVVTISISNTKATSYGYLGPIKAMLDTTVCYLAKSFSEFSNIRFNSIGAGPLKTSASAGIPDYIENYLFSTELTMRKEALKTSEVASTVGFLLSDISSGVNAQTLIVDAGMSSNYFDQTVVKSFAQTKY
ncbi:MAG: SDR family oxidoreductase [Bacteriovoracaceae bacterium]|jgi:enoyl-[acyl-carrier protein] reductase I|nr:SDR family oxidoreductase [Bacteriovoracaceae bacterium]